MAVTPEWIAAKRAELVKLQEQHIGLINQVAGGLKILDELQAELTRPDEAPGSE